MKLEAGIPIFPLTSIRLHLLVNEFDHLLHCIIWCKKRTDEGTETETGERREGVGREGN
jgi:hypothetical protein